MSGLLCLFKMGMCLYVGFIEMGYWFWGFLNVVLTWFMMGISFKLLVLVFDWLLVSLKM